MDGDNAKRGRTDQLGIPGYVGCRPVGAGGFGFVYRARQVAFDREVAVKVLAAAMEAGSLRRRFERECKAIGSLSGHPYIVTVYESGIDGFGRPFIAMDFMPGGSFADRVRRQGPLSWRDVVDVGIKLAGAAATAHDAGILHRDIKPENVLLSGYGQPKLADFGISTMPGGYHTHTGTITGSLSHAAPETLSGGPAGEASDVYSLASTLFFMVSGSPPFRLEEGETFPTLIARILNDPLPDLRESGIPDTLCSALERALAREPHDRIPSAMAFGRALQDVQRTSGLTPTDIPVAVVGATAPEQSELRGRARLPSAPPSDRPAHVHEGGHRAEDRPRRWSLLVAATLVASVVSVASVGFAGGWIGERREQEGSAVSSFARGSSLTTPSSYGPGSTPKPTPNVRGERSEPRHGKRPLRESRRRRGQAAAKAGATRRGTSSGGSGPGDDAGPIEPSNGGEVPPTPPEDPPKTPAPPPSMPPTPPSKQPPPQPPASIVPSAPPQG